MNSKFMYIALGIIATFLLLLLANVILSFLLLGKLKSFQVEKEKEPVFEPTQERKRRKSRFL
jgi:hypothetical protein